MKAATIYKVGNKNYLIHSDIMTASGFRIAFKPFFNIIQNSTDDIVSTAIKKALKYDENLRLPDPSDWPTFNKEYLQQLGLKTSNDLYRQTTKNIAITLVDNSIVFTPTRHAEKPDKGFLHKNKEEVTVSYLATDEEIASALQLAFTKCE